MEYDNLTKGDNLIRHLRWFCLINIPFKLKCSKISAFMYEIELLYNYYF